MTAREAAEALGVSLETVYAYVSRGLIRSETGSGGGRARRYSAEDVARLKTRKEQRRDPELAVQGALDWGAPVLESNLTLIADGKLYYRGQDAVALAETRSFEEIAALLWTGEFGTASRLFAPGSQPPLPAPLPVGGAPRGLVVRFQVALALASEADPAAWDLRAEPMAAAGARIIRLLAGTVLERPTSEGSVAAELARGWVGDQPKAERLLNAALVLCADHELNVSSFTARCVASAGSPPYAVVAAGLAALQGHRHGGHTERVAALLREVETAGDVQAALGARLRRGEPLPGFGHPLYPEGDVRGRLLLRRAREAYPASPAVQTALEVAAAGHALLGEFPTVDFGLVTLARALRLPDESALALFALGRTAGWIAHALEQNSTGRLIRPRARYTGPAPAATAAGT